MLGSRELRSSINQEIPLEGAQLSSVVLFSVVCVCVCLCV